MKDSRGPRAATEKAAKKSICEIKNSVRKHHGSNVLSSEMLPLLLLTFFQINQNYSQSATEDFCDEKTWAEVVQGGRAFFWDRVLTKISVISEMTQNRFLHQSVPCEGDAIHSFSQNKHFSAAVFLEKPEPAFGERLVILKAFSYALLAPWKCSVPCKKGKNYTKNLFLFLTNAFFRISWLENSQLTLFRSEFTFFMSDFLCRKYNFLGFSPSLDWCLLPIDRRNIFSVFGGWHRRGTELASKFINVRTLNSGKKRLSILFY